MKNLLLCCLAATLAVSSCQKTSIRQTLEKAGENRRELETVLEHYKNEPLKEKAARFLLETWTGISPTPVKPSTCTTITWTVCSAIATETVCSGS